MPGVLTVEEVEALDLDHWLLLVHGSFVHMIVSDLSSAQFIRWLYIYIICLYICIFMWDANALMRIGSRWVGEYADDESSIGEGDYG